MVGVVGGDDVVEVEAVEDTEVIKVFHRKGDLNEVNRDVSWVHHLWEKIELKSYGKKIIKRIIK